MLLTQILRLVAGLALLLVGANFFVKSARDLAKRFGISDFIIGLTLVAVGTSLPELSAAVAGSFKGLGNIVVGNLVGANIANIGLIVGIAAVLAGIKSTEEMLRRDGYIMLLAAILFLVFVANRTFSRWEGILFIAFYLSYILFLIEIKRKGLGRTHLKEFIVYFFRLGFLQTIASTILPDPMEPAGTEEIPEEGSEAAGGGKTVIIGLAVLAGSLLAVSFGAVYFPEIFGFHLCVRPVNDMTGKGDDITRGWVVFGGVVIVAGGSFDKGNVEVA